MYRNSDPTAGFDSDNRPFPDMNTKDIEDARRVYAMVSNIDDNVGRLLKKLDDLNLADNTVVIFLTDNGPSSEDMLEACATKIRRLSRRSKGSAVY